MADEKLSKTKQALVLKRLGMAASGKRAKGIPHRSSDAPTALSFAQQRLWILDQLRPGLALYNIPSAWRMDGRLDKDILEKSLNALVERHEALRTTFTTVGGTPQQVIHPEVRLTVPVVDLRGVAAAEREAEARRLAAIEAELPFVLDQGPLVRAQLLRLKDESHLLLLTMHHIVSDGWTLGVVGQELASVYGAFLPSHFLNAASLEM